MFKKKSRIFKRKLTLLTVACLLLLLIITLMFFLPDLKGHGLSSLHHVPSPFGQTATSDPFIPTLSPTSSVTPTPLFLDDFAENGENWALSSTNDNSGYSRTMINGQLVLSDTNHKILIESLPTNATFNNFVLTVTFVMLKGDENDSVGSYVRGDTNLDHDYRIDIFGDNKFSISKELLSPDKTAQTQILVGPAVSPLLMPKGQANTLTVMMKGPCMVVAINGTIAASVVDADNTRGQIALFVNNGATSDGVSASFSSVRIDPAPDQLPGFPANVSPTVAPQS